MGLVGRLEWMNILTKKQCRSLFWRMRAAMKKAVKNKKNRVFLASHGGKKQFRFQYDPSSYALNFDDGVYDHHLHNHHLNHHHHHDDHDHVVENEQKQDRETDDDHQIIAAKIPPSEKQEHGSHSASSTTTWVYVIWVGSF